MNFLYFPATVWCTPATGAKRMRIQATR